MTVPFEDHGPPRGCAGILLAVLLVAVTVAAVVLLAIIAGLL